LRADAGDSTDLPARSERGRLPDPFTIGRSKDTIAAVHNNKNLNFDYKITANTQEISVLFKREIYQQLTIIDE
jgi:hypothetical protein